MDFFLQGFLQAAHLLLTGNADTFSAVEASLVSTLYAMILATALGLPLGLALGYGNFLGRRVIRLISDTLLAFPTVLIGLLVYALIMRKGPLGEWGLLFTLEGMALGQAILALPIVTSLTAQAVENLDPRCRQSLLTLGANAWQMALGTIRELRFAILLVLVTAFGRVITEVGVAMMLGGNIRWHTRTITTAITLETNKGEFAQGIALGLVLLLMAFILNFCLAFLRREGRRP